MILPRYIDKSGSLYIKKHLLSSPLTRLSLASPVGYGGELSVSGRNEVVRVEERELHVEGEGCKGSTLMIHYRSFP